MQRYIICFTVLLLFQCRGYAFSAEADSIVVEGIGADPDSCRKDALMNAVKQLKGMFSDGHTTLTNNEIQENILEVSNGFVERYEILQEPQKSKDLLFHCKLRVSVRSRKSGYNVQRGTSMKDAAAEIISKAENEKQGIELLKRYLADIERKLLVVRVIDEEGNPVNSSAKPKIEKTPEGKIKCTWRLQVYFDLKNYYEYACPVLDKVFTAIGTPATNIFILNAKDNEKDPGCLEGSRFYELHTQVNKIINAAVNTNLKYVNRFIVFLSIGRDEKATQERYKIFTVEGIDYAKALHELTSPTPVLNVHIVKSDKNILRIDSLPCGSGGWSRRVWASMLNTSINLYNKRSERSVWYSPRFVCYINDNNEAQFKDSLIISYTCVFDSPHEIEAISHLQFSFSNKILSGGFHSPSKTLLNRQ